MARKPKKEGIYVYMYIQPSHFAIEEKPKPHCKTTVLQKKMNKKKTITKKQYSPHKCIYQLLWKGMSSRHSEDALLRESEATTFLKSTQALPSPYDLNALLDIMPEKVQRFWPH